jgi:hypothetical protein
MLSSMASKSGFFDYIVAAFNARPFGMFVAPNWVALGAFGLLGTVEPGFWVLGAGLELGYLLLLATNERFQRLVNAKPMLASMADWNKRIQALLAKLDANDRRVYELLAQRCRSIIDLQMQNTSAGAPGGLESQTDGLGRLSWMFLRLLVARRTIQHVIGNPADGGDLKKRLAALERQRENPDVTEELRRSVTGQIDILNQRLQQRTDAERKLTFLDSELERIQQQVELIREQAALSTDPELLSQRIDEITATLGTTGQWIRDQQKVYGAMEDLLTEPPPLAPDARARISE